MTLKVWKAILLCVLISTLSACNFPEQSTPTSQTQQDGPPQPKPTLTRVTTDPSPERDASELAQPGERFVATIDSQGIGALAVQVSLPDTPRYGDGAGVVVLVSTYFTSAHGFQREPDVTQLGLIGVSYLWPGESDPSGARSEGTFDFGGEVSIRALRDVIRYASGELPDRDGLTLPERVDMPILSGHVGLYAFSHPGIAAVNVIALHGSELPSLAYLVGRENPTMDILSAVEVGHWGEDRKPVENPLYRYPSSYAARGISLDFSAVRWDADYIDPDSGDAGRAYLDLNSSGAREESDFTFGARIPRFYEKRYHSIELTKALLTSGALTPETWPGDLATVEETEQIWPFHSSVDRYPMLASASPDLKVMLVFARRDHVQPARDKPHIHHAYDGFHHAAALWTRLNPDMSYIDWIDPEFAGLYVENQANSEPVDWMEIHNWAYPDFRGASGIVPLAAIAEMADRLHGGNWNEDLDAILNDYPAPGPG